MCSVSVILNFCVNKYCVTDFLLKGDLLLLNFEASSQNKIQFKKKMLPSFYSNSHDLKNKITQQKINLHIIKTEPTDNKLKQYLKDKSYEIDRITSKHYLTTGVLPGGGSVRMTFVGITVRLVPSILVTIQFFGSHILVENVYRLFGILTLLSSFTNTASLCKQVLKR